MVFFPLQTGHFTQTGSLVKTTRKRLSTSWRESLCTGWPSALIITETTPSFKFHFKQYAFLSAYVKTCSVHFSLWEFISILSHELQFLECFYSFSFEL